jgi:hypothetical protein
MFLNQSMRPGSVSGYHPAGAAADTIGLADGSSPRPQALCLLKDGMSE